MHAASHKSPVFDVVRSGDRWVVKGPRGRTIISSTSQKVAVALAWLAAIYLKPATVRLVASDGRVERGWNCPA